VGAYYLSPDSLVGSHFGSHSPLRLRRFDLGTGLAHLIILTWCPLCCCCVQLWMIMLWTIRATIGVLQYNSNSGTTTTDNFIAKSLPFIRDFGMKSFLMFVSITVSNHFASVVLGLHGSTQTSRNMSVWSSFYCDGWIDDAVSNRQQVIQLT